MAFHYQNLIQEKDFSYPEFGEHYAFIKEVVLITKKRIAYNGKTSFKHLLTTASTVAQNPYFYLNKDQKLKPNRVERILFITNFLFSDNKEFIDNLIEKYNIDIEGCYKLKEVLNTLNRADKDFLDSTMDALVNYHIPNFSIIKAEYGLEKTDEFIIWKLMEILYFYPELLEKQAQKKKF